jgi:hypothetical protein
LPSVWITRAALVAAPFVAWFLWAAWARRAGRPPGATPWPWLVAAAGALVALALMASAVFHRDNPQERHIPGEPEGRVTQGPFERQ